MGTPADSLDIGLLAPIGPVAEIETALEAWGSVTRYHAALERFADEHADAAHQILKLLEEGRKSEAKRLTHTIKGLTLGLTDVVGCAAKLGAVLAESSAQEQVPGLLKAMRVALDEAVTAIRKIELLEQEEQPRKVHSFDQEGIRRSIEKLLPALKRGESDDVLVASLKQQLYGHISDGDLALLDNLIDNFEHDEASKMLEQIADLLNIEWG